MDLGSVRHRACRVTVSYLRFVRLLELVLAARFVVGRGKEGEQADWERPPDSRTGSLLVRSRFVGVSGSFVRSARCSLCF